MLHNLQVDQVDEVGLVKVHLHALPGAFSFVSGRNSELGGPGRSPSLLGDIPFFSWVFLKQNGCAGKLRQPQKMGIEHEEKKWDVLKRFLGAFGFVICCSFCEIKG